MGNRKTWGRFGARHGYVHPALGAKLIALLDVQEQAFGSYMCLNFHTCCKGKVKLPYGMMELDVFGQLLLSAG